MIYFDPYYIVGHLIFFSHLGKRQIRYKITKISLIKYRFKNCEEQWPT